MLVGGTVAAIKGVADAELRWSYYVAAKVENYTLYFTKAGERWSVAGKLVLADAFKLSQKPLWFVARVRIRKVEPPRNLRDAPRVLRTEPVEWRWPVTDLTRRPDGGLTARLGQPVGRDPRSQPIEMEIYQVQTGA